MEITLVGVGLYTWNEAARLVSVPPLELRRWLKGYSFSAKDGNAREMPPLWETELAAADLEGISFQDLLEARVVLALRRRGVSLQFIRQVRIEAADMFRTQHPFSTQRILTDGERVFAKTITETGEERVLDIMKRQYGLERVLAPPLSGVVFDADTRAVRWYPMPNRTSVMLDPDVAFGKPVVTKGCVRTDILADAVKAEGSMARVARLYEVPVDAVRSAVTFEQRLAA